MSASNLRDENTAIPLLRVCHRTRGGVRKTPSTFHFLRFFHCTTGGPSIKLQQLATSFIDDSTMRKFSAFSCAYLAFLLYGCGGPTSDYREVSGSVTFKGSLLDHGTIQFLPEDEKTAGRFGGGVIENGKYLIKREQGLKPGKYRVVISSGEKGTKAADPVPGESGPPAKERIPAKYNSESRIEVEVKSDGQNVFDFTIP